MPRLFRLLPLFLFFFACNRSERALPEAHNAARPSILLVTLDTTRVDAIGPGAKGVVTPAFNALVTTGRRYTQAYATAPQTLPSHTSMMTGTYPGGHGVHENARTLSGAQPLLAEKLREAGYRTAAFISGFPLVRRFGLARGFELYDDELPRGGNERGAKETTDRAVAWLARNGQAPLFLWVHYFDPHAPYEPPEPFRSRYANDPYRGEVAAMDEQLGRLIAAFRQRAGRDAAIVVVGDHGEGLGEHGEAQHGNLLYQGVMHVPFVVAGPGIAAGEVDTPISTRHVFDTILGWAGAGAQASVDDAPHEVVLGEAMIPFLQYGWQPQVMAVEGSKKAIHAGTIEVYDVLADPAETHDLAATADLSRDMRKVLLEYPIPSLKAPPSLTTLTGEERKRLASLGYIASEANPVIRKDAPRPRDMAPLFETLDKASGLFVAEHYREAIPLLEAIVARDPHNLMAVLRIAAAQSALGENAQALAAFHQAEALAPDSPDVRHYLALHYAKSGDWERATPMLERIVAETPDRMPALQALAEARERQKRFEEALQLRQQIAALSPPNPTELVHLGMLAMEVGRTDVAVQSFERARALQGGAFKHDLELGVLYLSAHRLEEARAALDRVPPSHPAHAMALFKRAQVSVLLGEADRAARIAAARAAADATTRPLIANERLFQ